MLRIDPDTRATASQDIEDPLVAPHMLNAHSSWDITKMQADLAVLAERCIWNQPAHVSGLWWQVVSSEASGSKLRKCAFDPQTTTDPERDALAKLFDLARAVPGNRCFEQGA